MMLKFHTIFIFILRFYTMRVLSSKNLANPRLYSILVYGFASGLPFVLTASTLQAWLSQEHINIRAIGALSLLGIPYTIKFLWAPLLDHFSFNFLGKRLGWVFLSQLAVAIALFCISFLHPVTEFNLMMCVAFAIAFFSATQDIAIDAYRTDILRAEERGIGASYFVFAYRIALLVAGGLALIIADNYGWQITYQCMAFLILLTVLETFFAPRPEEYRSISLYKTLSSAFLDLLERDKFFIIFLFIIFYKFGDALGLSMLTSFLINGLNFSLSEIAYAYKFIGIVATILGGFVGGILLIRINLFWGLLWFGIAQAFSNLTFVALAMVGKSFSLMTFAIFVENFCAGLSTAALFAYLMALCNKRYAAAQYALFTATFAVGRVFLGPVASHIVASYGWSQLYIWSFILSFPGIIFLLMLNKRVVNNAQLSTE